MSRSANLNFVQQQGFRDAGAPACEFQYPALMFQPRLLGVLVVLGLVVQAPALFLTLSAILWWNVLVPMLNPFDVLYNSRVAVPKGLPRPHHLLGRGALRRVWPPPSCLASAYPSSWGGKSSHGSSRACWSWRSLP